MDTNQYFAQDPLASSDILTSLSEKIEAQPHLYWAALIDGAFDYPESQQAPYTKGGMNCYAFDAFEGLESAAPWLMQLTPDNAGKIQLKELLRHCRGRPMLSFVASHQSIETLKNGWANQHWITTADGQRMLLRIADTRILPQLPQALTPAQWAALTFHLGAWLFINREGRLESCPLAPEDMNAGKDIQLSQAQLDLLTQAAEPDAVIDLLAEGMPEIIPSDLKKSQFYGLIAESCKLGQQYEVKAFPDTVSLSIAACLTRGLSNSNPKLLKILASRNWPSGKLGDILVAQEII